MASRAHNFNLGVHLGWLHEAAAYGGRPVTQMAADLERVRSTATLAGFTGFIPLVDEARAALQASQSPARVLEPVRKLVTLFQSQVSAAPGAGLNAGFVLGSLEQAARTNTWPPKLAAEQFETARTHATFAGYANFDGYVGNAIAKLNSGQPVSSVLGEAMALIGLFQGQL